MWLLDGVRMVGGKLFLLGERSLLFVEVDRERGRVDGDVEFPVRSRLVQTLAAVSMASP